MIRTGLTAFFILTVFASSGSAQDSLYLEAGRLYEQGRYEESLEAYQSVVDSGYAAADLYYNMGNAAFRANNTGLAILCFEKALKADPGHEDARHNLEYVSRYRVDIFEEVPVFFLRRWIRAFVGLLPERGWSLLAAGLFILSLVSTLFYLFSRRLALKKTGFFTAVPAMVIFGVSLACAVTRHREIREPSAGIILSPSVVVRSTPSESGNELFILHEGTRVEVGEEVTGWQNVRVVDGREGWIPREDFGTI